MKIDLYSIRKGILYLKHYGLKEFIIRIREKREPDVVSYDEWFEKHCLKRNEIKRLNSAIKQNGISEDDVAIVSESNLDMLKTIKTEYALIIPEGAALEKTAKIELLNAAIKGEELKQSGIHWEYKTSERKKSILVYSDMDIKGEIPWLKPDYSPNLLESYDYISGAVLMNRELYRNEMVVQGIDDGLHSILLRILCKEDVLVLHLPRVLVHVPQIDIPKFENHKRKYCENEKVSIIIPNKDESESLQKCIQSIQKSSYDNYEIIIVENNSSSEETFHYYREIATQSSDGSIDRCYGEGEHVIDIVTWKTEYTEFNYSSINNYGAGFAKGKYLILLNNDIEILTADWIQEMLIECSKPKIAVVGAKLYYPDDTIQHAGVTVGIGGHARGVASNMLTGYPRYENGKWDKTHVIRECSAVTAACLMIRKSVFDEVGGFNEKLAVAFNDVDLCLKIRKRGYLILFNPYVEAYHYESKSRGQENTEEKVRRFQTEIEYMRTEWNDILRYGDPYYNPGYSRVKNDYSLNGMS